jgi:hypothetical protein
VASIKIQSVAQPVVAVSTYTYEDLKLDLQFDYTINNELLRRKEIKDLKVDYDYACIRNSIYNMFTTIPGQKILNPVFGLNLMQYIFEEVNETTAQDIGNTIFNNVTIFEPRISGLTVEVIADPDNAQYIINLRFLVPTLNNNSSIQLVGTLSNSGFNFNK